MGSNLMPVTYIGNKPQKVDNVANTGLIWEPGQTHMVPASVAVMFAKYPTIWSLAPLSEDTKLGIIMDAIEHWTALDVAVAQRLMDSAAARERAASAQKPAEATEEQAEAARQAELAAQQAEAVRKAQEQEATEQALTMPTLPQSFDPLTKADIAQFAKANYNIDLDSSKMTKEQMVDAVRNTHNSRVLVS